MPALQSGQVSCQELHIHGDCRIAGACAGDLNRGCLIATGIVRPVIGDIKPPPRA